jgi:hypothetical protein
MIVTHTIFHLLLVSKVDLAVKTLEVKSTLRQRKGDRFILWTPQNEAVLLRKVKSQISTSCMYRKTPVIFAKTIMFFQFQVQIDTSAVQNTVNSKACAQQGKSSAIAHQADHDNGPFGQTQQQTTKMLTQI